MWLTRKQFEQEQIEREINFIVCKDYRKNCIDKNQEPDLTRIFAARLADERYHTNIKNIRETNPYKGLYFYAVDEYEGAEWFDTMIEYRGFRIFHYKKSKGLHLLPWLFIFEFSWGTDSIKVSGSFIDNFDLISIMGLIDDYYEHKFFRFEDLKDTLKKAGAYIDD